MRSLIFSDQNQKGAPGTFFFVASDRNPSKEVAAKDHSSSNPPKGSPDLKTKVDICKVDVKGFAIFI